MKIPLAIRFWWHIDKHGPAKSSKLGACWLWTGSDNGHYGVATRDDRSAVGAHVAAWFIGSGVWPTNNVLHKCDTPLCVRFTHLFEGTTKDNVADKVRKGRHMHGEMYTGHKLTDAIVRVIKRSLRRGDSQTRLAHVYGVSPSVVSNIHTGKKWRHVTI